MKPLDPTPDSHGWWANVPQMSRNVIHVLFPATDNERNTRFKFWHAIVGYCNSKIKHKNMMKNRCTDVKQLIGHSISVSTSEPPESEITLSQKCGCETNAGLGADFHCGSFLSDRFENWSTAFAKWSTGSIVIRIWPVLRVDLEVDIHGIGNVGCCRLARLRHHRRGHIFNL